MQPGGLQIKKNVPRTRRGQEYFSNPMTFCPFHCLFLCCRCGPRRVVEPGPQTCHLSASTVNCGGRLLDPPVIRFLRSTRVAQRLVTRGILSLEPEILRKGGFPTGFVNLRRKSWSLMYALSRKIHRCLSVMCLSKF